MLRNGRVVEEEQEAKIQRQEDEGDIVFISINNHQVCGNVLQHSLTSTQQRRIRISESRRRAR